jgi:hypothetical protein
MGYGFIVDDVYGHPSHENSNIMDINEYKGYTWVYKSLLMD